MDGNEPLDRINTGSVTTPEQLSALAGLLLENIPSDREKLWPGQIMKYLAVETQRRIAAGDHAPKFSAKEVYQDLGGNPKQTPWQWLNSFWKEIDARYYPEIQPRLMKSCHAAGLNVYPVLIKVSEGGNRAHYALTPMPLEPTALPEDEPSSDQALPATAIRYEQDLSLQLSWLGRLLFAKGVKWSSYRRFGFLTWQAAILIFLVTLSALAWFVLIQDQRPLTGQHLALLGIGIGFPWMGFRYVNRSMAIFDDRIMIAPDWMLAWKEFGATIEIQRSADPEGYSALHLRRYTGQCPVCSHLGSPLVRLSDGGVEYPSRIVGRCEESPREHVFSFDRVTKTGMALRKPPTQVNRAVSVSTEL